MTAKDKALTSIREQLKKELANIADSIEPPGGKLISTKGKVFTFPDGRSTSDPIECVILDWRLANTYYKERYDANKPQTPDCWAISKSLSAMKPSDVVEHPQHDTCGGCPRNEWGSSPTGGNAKACKNTRRIAVVPPDANGETQPLLLIASPTALRSFDGFVQKLSTLNMMPIQVVAKVGFKEGVDYPSVTFEPMEPHDNLELMWTLREKAQELLDFTPATDAAA